jgi:hypothetical protein
MESVGCLFWLLVGLWKEDNYNEVCNKDGVDACIWAER